MWIPAKMNNFVEKKDSVEMKLSQYMYSIKQAAEFLKRHASLLRTSYSSRQAWTVFKHPYKTEFLVEWKDALNHCKK